MKPRIFVSSVMSDYDEYRLAARNAITGCDCEPVMLEDYPSIPKSSRNACLEAVASSNIYLAIVGARGGWVAPSGMLAVEEEFEEAKKHKLPVLVFIQDVEMDGDAERLKEKLSDYVSGFFRRKFLTPLELQKQISEALVAVAHPTTDTKHLEQFINEQILSRDSSSSETRLHLFFTPEGEGELIDPVKIGTLKDGTLRIAHLPEVGLLSYERGKNSNIGIDSLSICESGSDSRSSRETCKVRLSVNSKGQIGIDIAVEAEITAGQISMAGMVILEGDVARELKKAFLFVGHFFDAFDRFHRYSRFLFNVGISGTGFKPFMKSYPSNNQVQLLNNRFMGRVNSQKPILAFDSPRVLGRTDFSNENEIVEPVLEMFRRRLS